MRIHADPDPKHWLTTELYWTMFILWSLVHGLDPKWLIPDPAMKFLSSGSGSYPYYLSIFGNYKKKFNQNEESKRSTYLPTICHFQFYTDATLQSYNTHSPEFAGIKLEITFLFICCFIFYWIRNNNSESWPRKKFRNRPEPDPQHCFKLLASVLLNF